MVVVQVVQHVKVVVHVLKRHVQHVQVIHQEAVVQNVEATNTYQVHIVRAVVGQIERVQTTIIHVQMVENYQVQIVIFKMKNLTIMLDFFNIHNFNVIEYILLIYLF